jgi:hypothetical protein
VRVDPLDSGAGNLDLLNLGDLLRKRCSCRAGDRPPVTAAWVLRVAIAPAAPSCLLISL